MSDETAYQPQIKTTWLIGTLAAFALFVVIGIYSKRMARDYPDYDQQRAQERMATLATVRKAENALLYPAVDAQGNAHAEWIDQTKGVIRIPIEEAMAQEIDALKAQPVAMGAVIPAAVPAAPAAGPPTAGATNAAPAKPSASLPSAGAPGAKTGAGPAQATTKPNP
jgi:hypothetical protein